MDDMQDILNLAQRLGRRIAQHPRAKAYLEAQQALRDDLEARAAFDAFQKQLEHIRNLERSGKPVEVAEKRKLEECEQRIASNPTLKRFMRAQADYVELMSRVERAMQEGIGQAASQSHPATSGASDAAKQAAPSRGNGPENVH